MEGGEEDIELLELRWICKFFCPQSLHTLPEPFLFIPLWQYYRKLAQIAEVDPFDRCTTGSLVHPVPSGICFKLCFYKLRISVLYR